MSFRRTALVATCAALALAVPRADAAVSGTINDPAGDAVSGAANDLTKVTVSVTGTTRAPKDLEVSFETVGAVSVQPGSSYQFIAETGCGTLYAYVYWSAADAGQGSSFQVSACGAADPTDTADGEETLFLDHTVKIAGNKISMSVPVKSVPAKMGLGSTFADPYAYTAPADPLVGFSTADFLGEDGANDYAAGTSFKLK